MLHPFTSGQAARSRSCAGRNLGDETLNVGSVQSYQPTDFVAFEQTLCDETADCGSSPFTPEGAAQIGDGLPPPERCRHKTIHVEPNAPQFTGSIPVRRPR